VCANVKNFAVGFAGFFAQLYRFVSAVFAPLRDSSSVKKSRAIFRLVITMSRAKHYSLGLAMNSLSADMQRIEEGVFIAIIGLGAMAWLRCRQRNQVRDRKLENQSRP
jgi:hypothetical protein